MIIGRMDGFVKDEYLSDLATIGLFLHGFNIISCSLFIPYCLLPVLQDDSCKHQLEEYFVFVVKDEFFSG